MTGMERRIAHLDMDAFYASVERLRYPQLAGLPLVVGGRSAAGQPIAAQSAAEFPRLRDYVGRGVATTASYEARAFGVHSAMGLMKAAALAPHAVLLPADFDEYRRVSALFKEAVAGIAPQIEDRGIDEIYIDLTTLPDASRALGQRIKDAVYQATGLTCSIGITPNKLLAKIASELDKPDGLTLLGHADLPDRVWPLAVGKINGIGPKAAQKLALLGIHTVGELAHADPAQLVERFGSHLGAWLHAAAHGLDDRPVVMFSEPKSISRETTFERDLDPRHDRSHLSRLLETLCARLAADLQRKGYQSRTIGVKLRYEDFRIVTRDRTLDRAVCSTEDILQAVRECLRRSPMDRRLRLLGVRASALLSRDSRALSAADTTAGKTLTLFD